MLHLEPALTSGNCKLSNWSSLVPHSKITVIVTNKFLLLSNFPIHGSEFRSSLRFLTLFAFSPQLFGEASPLTAPRRKHLRYECHLRLRRLHKSLKMHAKSATRRAWQGRQGIKARESATERRMVSEEEVKVMKERRMCQYILPLWMMTQTDWGSQWEALDIKCVHRQRYVFLLFSHAALLDARLVRCDEIGIWHTLVHPLPICAFPCWPGKCGNQACKLKR